MRLLTFFMTDSINHYLPLSVPGLKAPVEEQMLAIAKEPAESSESNPCPNGRCTIVQVSTLCFKQEFPAPMNQGETVTADDGVAGSRCPEIRPWSRPDGFPAVGQYPTPLPGAKPAPPMVRAGWALPDQIWRQSADAFT